MKSSRLWMRSSRVQWMRSSRVVRATGCQCQSRNSLGFDHSIIRQSEIGGAADDAMLKKVPKETKIQNPKNPIITFRLGLLSLDSAVLYKTTYSKLCTDNIVVSVPDPYVFGPKCHWRFWHGSASASGSASAAGSVSPRIRIRGSGSVPKCHGSGTLLVAITVKSFHSLILVLKKFPVKIILPPPPVDLGAFINLVRSLYSTLPHLTYAL